jgi:uncharacterized protein YndB with AHSA1/START domain
MEAKTKLNAEDNKQDLLITREFELPVDLLFRAYVEPEIVEQWVGTKVLKLENKRHGSWQFETTDPKGNKHGFNGVIHEFVPNEKITRTFEMESGGFPVQLEFLKFEKINEDESRLQMHIVYRSVADRDRMLQIGFRQGINMAHNRLQETVKKLKQRS